MKDLDLYEELGLEQTFNQAPHYCGEYRKVFHASLYVGAWKQYEEGYTPSYIEITCPLLKNGHVIYYASENEFSLATVKNILNTIKKCLEYYK